MPWWSRNIVHCRVANRRGAGNNPCRQRRYNVSCGARSRRSASASLWIHSGLPPATRAFDTCAARQRPIPLPAKRPVVWRGKKDGDGLRNLQETNRFAPGYNDRATSHSIGRRIQYASEVGLHAQTVDSCHRGRAGSAAGCPGPNDGGGDHSARQCSLRAGAEIGPPIIDGGQRGLQRTSHVSSAGTCATR